MGDGDNRDGDNGPRKKRGRRRRSRGPGSDKQADATEESSPTQDDVEREGIALQSHFSHLRRFRKVLRLRLNAHEDLLVNGQRPPDHPGVCRHLLDKVDRKCVEAALTRLEDGVAQIQLLAGIVQFNSDVALLLLYLEHLERADHSGDRIGPALATALRRTAFAELSAAQMRRLMDVLVRVVPTAERSAVFLGLLDNHQFATAFRAHAAELSPEVGELLRPMAALRAAVRGKQQTWAATDIHAGLATLLERPDAGNLPQRSDDMGRLCRLAIRAGLAAKFAGLCTHPGVLQHWSEVVPALIGAAEETAARQLLSEVVAKQPQAAGQASRWLESLDWPRLGPIACRRLAGLGGDHGSTDAPTDKGEPPHLRPLGGLHLPTMQPVWLFVALDADSAAAVADQAIWHQRLWSRTTAPLLWASAEPTAITVAQPGASDVEEFAQEANQATAAHAALAVVATGQPLNQWLRHHRPGPGELKSLAAQGYALLRDLARAQADDAVPVLADALLRRFAVADDGALCLFNLSAGASPSPARESLARDFIAGLVEVSGDAELALILDAISDGSEDKAARQLAAFVSPAAAEVAMGGGSRKRHGKSRAEGRHHEKQTLSQAPRSKRQRDPQSSGPGASAQTREKRGAREKKTRRQEHRSDL